MHRHLVATEHLQRGPLAAFVSHTALCVTLLLFAVLAVGALVAKHFETAVGAFTVGNLVLSVGAHRQCRQCAAHALVGGKVGGQVVELQLQVDKIAVPLDDGTTDDAVCARWWW